MSWNPFAQRRIYLDHAAATPLRREVSRAMRRFEREVFANAGGVHMEGRKALEALEQARASVASTLVTTRQNIVFTSGGTESNNLALFGVVEKLHESGRPYESMEIVSTAIEHPSLLEPLRVLSQRGVVVRYAPVDNTGRISEKEYRELITPQTVLVTFAYANSEIGTVQDVKALSRIVRLMRNTAGSIYPLVHIDASQAPLWLPCKMDSLGIDMMSIDAGKCYGPKGVGVLALRGVVPLTPYLRGGGQEGGLRPGTENVGSAVGCALALSIAQQHWESRAERARAQSTRFREMLEKVFPTLQVNGSTEYRLPNNVNVSIPGIDGEYAVIGLDQRGIACSTRSACKVNEATEEGGSHVLRALGHDSPVVLGAIRFSLGEETTPSELQRAVRALAEHVRIATFPTRA